MLTEINQIRKHLRTSRTLDPWLDRASRMLANRETVPDVYSYNNGGITELANNPADATWGYIFATTKEKIESRKQERGLDESLIYKTFSDKNGTIIYWQKSDAREPEFITLQRF
jgi:hypothetical protein